MTAARARPLLLVLALLASCVTPEEPPREDRLELEPIGFDALPGWGDDDQAAALVAFRASCDRLRARGADASVGRSGVGGVVADWLPACDAGMDAADGDAAAARAFFESWFQPYAASNAGDPTGLFTGYFEPLLHGSRERSETYSVPLHARPEDLVTVDLATFAEDLEGRSIAGRVAGGTLVLYPERAEIVAGALDGQGAELVWVDDPVDAFFLQIQGSGIVELAEGGRMRIGYAASNGRSYLAIGKPLIERGAIPKDQISMQAIRAWLADNPNEAAAVMNLNRSYVFFREIDGPGPIGAQGVALTPGRSLAVDRAFLPLGVPLWLDILIPGPTDDAPDEPMRRLVVAQDTGGAIKGPVRGDLFWGTGEEAGSRAGRMKHEGRYFLLLPKVLVVAGP